MVDIPDSLEAHQEELDLDIRALAVGFVQERHIQEEAAQVFLVLGVDIAGHTVEVDEDFHGDTSEAEATPKEVECRIAVALESEQLSVVVESGQLSEVSESERLSAVLESEPLPVAVEFEQWSAGEMDGSVAVRYQFAWLQRLREVAAAAAERRSRASQQ